MHAAGAAVERYLDRMRPLWVMPFMGAMRKPGQMDDMGAGHFPTRAELVTAGLLVDVPAEDAAKRC